MNLPSDDVDIEVNVIASTPNALKTALNDLGHLDVLQHRAVGVVFSGEIHQIADQSR